MLRSRDASESHSQCSSLVNQSSGSIQLVIWGVTPRHPAELIDANQVGRKATQWLDMLGPHLKRRSVLSFTNGILLCKLLIRRMTDYACPVRRNTARTYSCDLHEIHSKCLCIATNTPCYVGNKHIHQDFGQFFADCVIGALTKSSYSYVFRW